jgi:hypothetical protein
VVGLNHLGLCAAVYRGLQFEDLRKTNRQQKKREGLVFSSAKDRAGIPLATTSSPASNFNAVLLRKNQNI